MRTISRAASSAELLGSGAAASPGVATGLAVGTPEEAQRIPGAILVRRCTSPDDVHGMIAAVASIFITPWNLFNNPLMIHYTLDILAAFIGPLFGILLVDFYLIKKQKIDVDALFDDSPSGRYYFDGGVNWTAVKALVPATLVGVAITFTPALQGMANFAWFTGCFLGGLFFLVLARREQLRMPVSLVAG